MCIRDSRLGGPEDLNRHYEAVAFPQRQHLEVETVNRYTVTDKMDGSKRKVRASVLPFGMNVFKDCLLYTSRLQILNVDYALLPALGAEQGKVAQHCPSQEPKACFCFADRAKHPLFLRIIHALRLFSRRRQVPCEKRDLHGFAAFQCIRFHARADGRRPR